MTEHLEFGDHMKPLPHEEAIRKTFLGQAHIAGTGPDGKTCRECAFWGVEKWKDGETHVVSPGFYSQSNKTSAGQLKKGGCFKLRHRKANRKFPNYALACRLFEQSEMPPPPHKDIPIKERG